MATGKAGVCSIGTVHTANKKRETAQARTLGAGWEECEGKLHSTGFALKTCVTFDDVSFCGERCTHELSTLRVLRKISNHLVLELQVAMSHPTRVRESSWSLLQEAASTLNHLAISPTPNLSFLVPLVSSRSHWQK